MDYNKEANEHIVQRSITRIYSKAGTYTTVLGLGLVAYGFTEKDLVALLSGLGLTSGGAASLAVASNRRKDLSSKLGEK